ncbi:MAG TPA: tetratricopeptide repeat protein [Bryobacteraceae bacterium]|nr:tetratricopeptide repeat protein [Bryobacteraceae bacterium]
MEKYRLTAAAVGVLALAACATSPQQKEAKFLKKGDTFMARKDYARALLEFKNAARAMPRDAEAFYRIGLASLAAGSPSGAVSAFQQATQLNPRHSEAQLKLAELMAASRNKDLTEDAQKRLLGVLAASPDNAEAVDTLAFTEVLLGHTDEASRRLEDLLRKFPARLQSAVALARLKLADKDPAGAEAVLKEAAEHDPKNPDAAVALGQFYAARQNPAAAEAQVGRALSLNPKSPAALLTLAAIQVSTHRLAEADQTYQQISALPDPRYRPLHAIYLFQQNQRDAALAEFQKLYERDPNDRAARSRLVAVEVMMNRIPQAEQVLAGALKRNPKDLDALLQRSQLLLRAGKASDAEKDLQQVLHLRADSAEAHFGLADVRRQQGRTLEQQQQLSEALRLDPTLAAARLTLAKSYVASRQPKSALALLDQTPKSQQNLSGIVLERNWALLAAGDTQEARSRIDQLLKVYRVPEAVLQDGLLKMEEKDFSGARASAEEILRGNPRDIQAARLMADSYLAQKQASKAIERLRQLAAAQPTAGPLQLLLGQLLAATGNRADARAAFQAAKSAAPSLAQPDLELAMLDISDRHWADAQKRLSGVIASDPRNVRALLLLAGVDSDTGNSADAISRYRAVLAIDGSNLPALNNLAYLLVNQNPDEALGLAQHALELAPDNPAVEDTLGWVYYRKAIYQTAANYLNSAFHKEPTARREFHLGMSYVKMGDSDRGRQMIGAALEKDPNLVKTEQGW